MPSDGRQRIRVWVQHFADRGTLQLQWIDPATGKRKTRSAGTADEGEAEQARSDLEYELNNGLHRERSRMSWERFRELFEEEYLPNLREDTRRNYQDTANLFERLCHPANLASVNERMLSAFVAAMRKEPGRGSQFMQPSTIRVRLQFLHTMLTWAKEQKLLAEVPNFPAVRVPRRKPQPVPLEAFERLLEKAPTPEWKAFLLCAWLAGLRLKETMELERRESQTCPYVAWDRNRIILPAVFAKAVEDQWVPLDPVLKEVLLSLPDRGPKVFSLVRQRPPGKGLPLSDVTVSGFVRRLAEKAGVRMTFKSLRRGFGCRYAGKVPAQVLQRLMRHANITTTMTFYANVDQAVEDAVLGPREPQRNGSCNTPPHSGPAPMQANDATHCEDGSSE